MSEYYIKFRSNYLDSTVDLTVIMPNPYVGHSPKRFYTSGKKFPVLWLLHGGKETLNDWVTYSYIPRLAIFKNVIIVAPSAPNSDFINQPLVGEGFNFSDCLYEELMPWIHNWFPASDKPKDNFLVGSSMGCEAVWRHGIAKPELFGCIAPLGSIPKDYRCLEAYRHVKNKEFRALATDGTITGPDGKCLSAREINSICKYNTIGDFLESIENTMPRFEEAAAEGKLPKIYFPNGVRNAGQEEVDEFLKKTKAIRGDQLFIDQVDAPFGTASFVEKAVEQFMNHVGLENIERNDGTLPILTGVHEEIEDDSNGITLH